VFVVDDDERVLRALARLVKSAGLPVETFASPKELLSRGRPDEAGCIVLDLRMPELDGLQVQQALAGAGFTMPIVFLSGYGDVASSVQAMKAGAVDFLTKPADEEALLAAIRRAVARDAAARAQRHERDSLRARFELLTPREREVCALVVAGLRNKQIAEQLGTAEKTVKIHRGQVMHKLGAPSLAGLVRMVDRAGLALDPLDERPGASD
jgi:FixJ family two-component response regulator